MGRGIIYVVGHGPFSVDDSQKASDCQDGIATKKRYRKKQSACACLEYDLIGILPSEKSNLVSSLTSEISRKVEGVTMSSV
jgi:hypothetical protein